LNQNEGFVLLYMCIWVQWISVTPSSPPAWLTGQALDCF